MRFIHCSDLHLGRRLGELDLLDDQAFLLDQLIQLARTHRADALLLAGDLYDRSVPGIGAVRLLDRFFTACAKAQLPVYAVSGNHDSAERLDYASGFLENHGVHLASVFSGNLARWDLQDEFGPLTLWGLPFVKPGGVRHFFPEAEIADYTDAVRCVLEAARPDFARRNVLMAHQFVTGKGTQPQTAGSESVNVGTLDNVDASVFGGFDYVALGHIHGAQCVGSPTVRYCGTPLKYSAAEARQQKSVLLVELGEKGCVECTPLPIVPLHDLRRIEGPLEDLLACADAGEDYIYAVLTDPAPVMDAAARLRAVYPNLIKIDFTYARTRASAAEEILQEPEREKPPLELFDEFYASVHGAPMTQQERDVMQDVFEEVCP